MAAKFFLVACATALLINAISACPCGSAYIGNVDLIGSGLVGYGGGCGYGLGASNIVSPSVAVSSGGAFGVTSSSAYAPSGVQVISNNEIQGALEVIGVLPLVAAVAFDGALDSAGQAGTTYSCGNGNVGIAADSLATVGFGSGAYNGLSAANLGLGAVNYGSANIGNAILGAEIIGLNGGYSGIRSGCGCY